MHSILWLAILLCAPATLCTLFPPVPRVGYGPVVPVSPVLPVTQYVDNSVAHVHGYVEKPVEYLYQTYKLAPKVEEVSKLSYVPKVTDIQGLAKVPQIYDLQKVAYAPKSIDVQTLKVVQVPKTVPGYVVQPTVYSRPQLEYVPDSQLVQTVNYKPVVLTKYGLTYVPRDEVIKGVNVNVVQQEVPGYRLAPKTYTQTGIRYNVYSYPVPGYRYEPREYINTRLMAVPITQQQLGIKFLPKDYIVKTYQPIVISDLASSTSTGSPIYSAAIDARVNPSANLAGYSQGIQGSYGFLGSSALGQGSPYISGSGPNPIPDLGYASLTKSAIFGNSNNYPANSAINGVPNVPNYQLPNSPVNV